MTCLEAGEVHYVRGCERVSRESGGNVGGTKWMDGMDGRLSSRSRSLAGTLMGYVTAADCDRTDTARRGEKWRVLIYANPCSSHRHHEAHSTLASGASNDLWSWRERRLLNDGKNPIREGG